MNMNYMLSILGLFLLVFTVDSINLPRKTRGEILESLYIEEIYELLDSTKLLKNLEYTNAEFKDSVNHTCLRDLNFYKEAAKKRISWALRMIDASSKVSSGILNGNIIDYGMFDECVESSGTIAGVEIRGHYCTYNVNRTLNTPLPLNFIRAICIPASCSNDDLSILLNRFINANPDLKDYDVSILFTNCIKTPPKITSNEILIVLFTVATCISFLILCTVFDVLNRRSIQPYKNKWIQLLIKFSYIKSAECIFDFETQGDFPAIHGIRALSCASIVLLNQYCAHVLVDNINFLDVMIKFYNSLDIVDAFFGSQAVDTFFILSSFLMTHSYFKQIYKNQKFNIIHHYLHRLIRLSLPIVVEILFFMFLWPVLASGPKCELFTKIFVSGIQTKWWSAVLYILNFIERENYALLHLWYVSADMQLYWMSPLILYSLYKRPKIGFALAVSLVILSLMLIAWIIGINGYSALYRDLHLPRLISSFRDVYLMTYSRIPPWIFGVLLGYEVSCCKNRKPSKMILYLGWILNAVIVVVVIFNLQFYTDEYNPLREMTFAVLIKIFWAFIICWTIYTSIHDSTGIVSKFLSWKIFLPVSRLSYCIYLFHPVLIVYQMATSRSTIHYTSFFVYHAFISNFVLSFVVSFFVSLSFERPMLVLNNLLFRRKCKSLYETKKTD